MLRAKFALLLPLIVPTAVAPPFPPIPARDQIINVRADFCNLYDRDGLVINEGYLPSLMATPGEEGRVSDWLQRIHAAGGTHVVVMGWGGSGAPDYAGGYPGGAIRFVDFMNPAVGLGKLKEILIRLIRDEHLTPIFFMAADGQTARSGLPHAGSGGAYGWTWFVNNVGSVIQQLRDLPGPDITPYILWTPGFELSISLPGFHTGNAGDHTPDQIQQEFAALRQAIGPGAQIASHLGAYIHVGHANADWLGPGLKEVDSILLEFDGNAARSWMKPRTEGSTRCGIEQLAARTLGPAMTFTPGSPCDGRNPPYYLSKPTDRGRRAVIAFETVAYPASHPSPGFKDTASCATDCQIAFHNYLWTLGFRHFGNGYPTATR